MNSFLKIALIFVIVVLTTYIVYSMIVKRNQIRLSKEGFTASSTEGFTASTTEGFTASTTNALTIQNITSSRASYSLFEYCIKASYNSAYNGSNITLLALDNVISRGCRFLDLEVYSIDDSPSVAYSVDPTFATLTSGNSLPLKDILNEIVSNSFTGNAPNPRDPLFIHLRINTTCGLNNQPSCSIYQQVASVLQNTLASKLYSDASGNAIPVTETTPLSNIAGKIVLVMDASVNRDYKNYAICDASDDSTPCYNLRKFINIETGGTTWKKYKFSDFLNQTQNKLIVDSADPAIAEPTTGTLSLQLALPDRGVHVQNASFPLSYIADYGCQTVAMKFYNDDAALKAYEALFNEYNTAFVPLGFAVQHISGENK
jgi:hypothetical protein